MSKVSFSVFQSNSKSRAYGFNNGDYQRYASHEAASIARIRKSAKLQQRTGGKKKVFEKKPVTDVKSLDSRHLAILLAEAERSFSTSQASKAAYSRNLSNGEAAAREKRHVINRLQRASQHSEALLTALRKVQVGELQEAEAAIYHLFLKSNYYFEKGSWSNAIAYLEKTQELLELLAEKSGSQTSEAIAYELLDEIQPILRVATTKASQSDAAEAKSVEGYEDLLKAVQSLQSDQSKTKSLTQLSWRNGEKIPLRNAELAVAVSTALKVIDAPQGNGKPSMKRFDKSLNALSEAEDLARKLVDDNQIALQRAHSTRFENASKPLTQTHQYLIYRLLLIRTQRDLHLIQTTLSRLHTKKNPQTSKDPLRQRKHKEADPNGPGEQRRRAKIWSSVIKLYDGVLQSYAQIRDLGLVESDGDMSERVENRILVARATRAYYLSGVYGLLESFDKALILNEHASLFVRQATSGLSLEEDISDDPLELPPFTSTALQKLEQDLITQRNRLSKDWFLSGPDEEKDEVGLNKLSLDSTAAQKKKGPLVFDITYNYASEVDMDALALKAEGKRIAQAVHSATPEENKDVDMKKEEELNPTPSKSRFLSWFGRG